jgi:Dolichyl-phosphate-mannose-protein mannosyltransferase
VVSASSSPTDQKSYYGAPFLPPTGVVAASLALCLVRLFVASRTGLTDDEAYYRLWGLAPALSYLDHPPMAGWLIWLGQQIVGDSALGVRLAAVLAPLLGTLLTWRTASLLFGESVAERAAWFSLAIPLLAVGGIVMTPDTPSVLAWGLTGWATVELWHSKQPLWWLAIGLFAGLGLLSKYTNLFAGAGLVVWVLASREGLRWARTWQFWAGGTLAAACALPVLVWNEAHHWESFTKQFGRVGAGHDLTLRYFGELIGASFGLLGPPIAILAGIGLWRAMAVAWRDRQSPEFLLLCSVVPIGVYLLLHSLHDRVQANWPAPMYPALAALAALAAAGTGKAATPFEQLLRRSAVPFGLGVCAVLYWHLMFPLVTLGESRDPTAQTRGWSEFGRAIEAQRIAVGAQWIATTSYATTGQLAFQERSNVPVLQIDERLRYINLPPVSEAILRAPALYVELQRREDPDRLRKHFRTVTALGALDRLSNGVPIATYVLYRLAEPTGPVLEPVD